jgi:PAS domain S-box-containing protein
MTTPKSGRRSLAARGEPAGSIKAGLSRLLADMLLSEETETQSPPIFFQSDDGALIWANSAYYKLAQDLSAFPAAQRLLHPEPSSPPTDRSRDTWSQDARAILAGRPSIVRAWYCRARHPTRAADILIGFLQVSSDDAELGHRMMRVQERIDDIVRLVSDWIWETDAAMNITFASDRVMHAAGYAPQTLIGKALSDLAYDATSAQRLRDRLMGLTPFRDLTVSFRAINGAEKNYLISAVPVFDPLSGAHLGFRGTAFDVTGLTERERAILAAKEAAEQANRAKSRFLANMSHELRTPLNAMIGFSDILRREGADRPAQKDVAGFASEINSSAKSLLAVINDILDIARIEAGRFDLREEETTAELLCKGAMSVVREQGDQHGVRLSLELGHNLPTIRVDTRVIRQVLVNLLSNAIKFTQAGGEIALRAQVTTDGELLLQVCDSGIGMTELDLKRVLEPFVQAENDNSRRFAGAGLGLSLGKRLIELHGGRLSIVSRPNMGTTVSVHLPPERIAAPQTI